jgi:nitroreductase
MGLYPREDRVAWVRGLFKLPEQVVPFALVVVGYAVEEKPSKMQLNKERLHFNAW